MFCFPYRLFVQLDSHFVLASSFGATSGAHLVVDVEITYLKWKVITKKH